MLVGTGTWLLGVLWAAESALYCTAMWIPAYVWLAYTHSCRAEKPRASAFRWCLLPVAALAIAAGSVWAFYKLRLGHGPDWPAYCEYAMSFGRGFGSLPLDPAGSVWVLLIVFFVSAAAAAHLVKRGLRSKGAGLAAAMLGMLWATSSYFVARSHPNNIDNLAPLVCLAIAIMLRLLADNRRADWHGGLTRAAFVPILAVIIGCTWGNAAEFPHWWRTAAVMPSGNVESLLPQAEPGLSRIMQVGGVHAGDPVLFMAPYLLPSVRLNGRLAPESAFRSWTPLGPLDLHEPLLRRRSVVYMRRFTARAQMSGWLIQPLHPSVDEQVRDQDELFAEIERTHVAARTVANADYRLTWYAYRGAQR
jgi:hypothetical protein